MSRFLIVLALFVACAFGQTWSNTNFFVSSSCSGNPSFILSSYSSGSCTPDTSCNLDTTTTCTSGSAFVSPSGATYIVRTFGGSLSTCADPTTAYAVEATGNCIYGGASYYLASCTGGKISYKECTDSACASCATEVSQSGCSEGFNTYCSDAPRAAAYFLFTIVIALIAIALSY